MIETIVKSDGRHEPFDSTKLFKWAEWASENVSKYVDWGKVVLTAVSGLPKICKSSDLQDKLIDTCKDLNTWSYYKMAGRLYASQLNKKIYPEGRPTVKALHDKLVNLKLMVTLDYTDAEYAEIESIINHSLDKESAWFSLAYINGKYAIRDRINNKVYETAQFVYMRMAMALAIGEPNKMKVVKDYYELFSEKVLNAPTPNYVNLGTPLRGYASCCVYTNNDNKDSLAVGDHIAYIMTCMSAGIGNNLQTRSLGDPVRGGAIKHRGKIFYYKAIVAATQANMQNGRGGAATTHFSVYDPEVIDILQLRNPRQTEDKRVRGMHFSMQTNKPFARIVAQDGMYSPFSLYSQPELHKAFYSDDEAKFQALYDAYVETPEGKRKSIRARDVLNTSLTEAFETGTAYLSWIDEMNRHTPFKDVIYSSNLCVAPETLITTKEGQCQIRDSAGESVEIWNGEEWSSVRVNKTGENQKLIKVKVDSGQYLECTEYHKWYVEIDSEIVEKRTFELEVGDKLITFKLPYSDVTCPQLTVTSIVDEGRIDDTYCFTEHKRNMGMFNGILTGQCVETGFVSKGYNSMQELYSTKFIHSEDGLGEQEPEIGLCSLAAINVAKIRDDAHYAKATYYALKMIDKCIHLTEYPFPHLELTAKARLNAGVGIVGLAHLMAKESMSYQTRKGKAFIHTLAETHAWHVINASLRLGKELGNAPWMARTKWPDGWLPIDTYCKAVDSITPNNLTRDWESLRKDIVANKGIRNSCVINFMPAESSSKASEATNSVYPVRDTTLIKTDDTVKIYWAAPDSDELKYNYELAWDIGTKDLIDCYAIVQKFTDQSISADLYRKVIDDEVVGTTELIDDYLYMTKFGMKSRYYQNSKTSSGELQIEDACGGGACKL